MKKKNRSRKSREAHAEYLLKVSVTMFIAFYITILIIPIIAIMKSMFDQDAVNQSVYMMSQNIGISEIVIFLLCEFCLFYIADITRERAYDIYDQLYPGKLNIR